MNENNNFLIYKNKEGDIAVDAILKDETLWLTQKGMATVFDCSVDNVSLHLKNIFKSKELDEKTVVEYSSITANDGKKYKTKLYNLDVIIAVGYRVNSKKATEFRIWANKIIKEHIIKGYTINTERFKNNGENPYFEELIEKIRDIRSSEKVFWRKVLDIYSTSIDYNPEDNNSIEFFKTIQNKFHYAVTKNTAAEIVYNRVDSKKDNVGLTNFKGEMPTKKDTEVAKNYLTLEELKVLNKLVSSYLDIAEINALNRKVMTMSDWLRELDDFLSLTHSAILKNKGNISHEKALKKAHEEYDKYMISHLTRAEKDYLKALNLDIKEINR